MDLIVDFPQSHSSYSRVSFDDHVEVIIVKNFSVKHKADLWFSDQETEFFRHQTASELNKMKSNSMPADHCTELLIVQDTSAVLGLESCLSESLFEEIISRREALMMEIRFEQERQLSIGICDPDILANISEVGSEWSRRRALMIGLLHAD